MNPNWLSESLTIIAMAVFVVGVVFLAILLLLMAWCFLNDGRSVR